MFKLIYEKVSGRGLFTPGETAAFTFFLVLAGGAIAFVLVVMVVRIPLTVVPLGVAGFVARRVYRAGVSGG